MGGPLETEEIKDEQAIGRVFMALVKHRITLPIVLAGAGAWGWLRPAPAAKEVYWDKREIQDMIRGEIERGTAPLEAGIRALAEKSKPETRIAVLEAMARAGRRVKE